MNGAEEVDFVMAKPLVASRTAKRTIEEDWVENFMM